MDDKGQDAAEQHAQVIQRLGETRTTVIGSEVIGIQPVWAFQTVKLWFPKSLRELRHQVESKILGPYVWPKLSAWRLIQLLISSEKVSLWISCWKMLSARSLSIEQYWRWDTSY